MAMGSRAHVVVHGGDEVGLVEMARRAVEDLEVRWSRFRDTSEVSRLNATRGAPMAVSGPTLLLVALALRAQMLTDGWFDPTLAPDLAAWGYDRTFGDVRDVPARREVGRRPTGGDTVELDRRRGTATVPPGLGFDPGGIGKGLAADLVCHDLLAAGASAACVNLGGDLRVGGMPPGRDGWQVGLAAEASATRAAPVIVLVEGGVATSSSADRHWRVGQTPVSHLLDPTTRRPRAPTDEATTVVATSAWRAEVLATAATVRGGADIDDWVARRGGRVARRQDSDAASRPGRGAA